MNPWAILGAVLLALGIAGGSYWRGHTDGANSELATQKREDDAAATASDAAASAIAAAIPKITVKHQTVKQELEREIQTREVYRDPDCRTGPGSLRRFNSAIPGYIESGPAGADSSAVPASGAGH